MHNNNNNNIQRAMPPRTRTATKANRNAATAKANANAAAKAQANAAAAAAQATAAPAPANAAAAAAKAKAEADEQKISAFEAAELSVDALNNLIESLYPGNNKSTVDIVEQLDETYGLDGALRMYSSGAFFDCLIHSFLTITCPNFRALDQNTKVEFAYKFRREMLLRLVDTKPVAGKARLQLDQFKADCLRESYFLSDGDAQIIAILFDVNILILEPESIYPPSPKAAILIQPNMENESDPYVIYGSRDHFEGVQLGDGGYTVDFSVAQIAISLITLAERGEGEDTCKFNVNQQILYKPQQSWETWTVVDRLRDSDTQCMRYTITNDESIVPELIKIYNKDGEIKDKVIERFGKEKFVKVSACSTLIMPAPAAAANGSSSASTSSSGGRRSSRKRTRRNAKANRSRKMRH